MDRANQLLRWGNQQQGHRVTAPGGIGGQCVDLVNLWSAQLGASHLWGNAVDLLRTASTAEWTVTLNDPTNAPPPGAIVVWGQSSAAGTGQYGHCAVALVATSSVLLVLEQDWPWGSPVRWGSHTYDGVQGWLTRR